MGSRDEWLELRRTGVGGSDAAAAVGESPYTTALELYYAKIGDGVPKDIDADGIERTDFGRALEGVVASQYAERFNVKLRRRNVMIRHPKYPFMVANVDRTIDGTRAGLEIKTVDQFAFRLSGQWGEPGTDEIPGHYKLQCAHYMACLDYPVWYLAALVGGNSMKRYIIERDRDFEDMLISGELRFWTHVETREPPPLDYQHPHAVGLMKRLYRGTNGETVKFDADMLHWHAVKLEAESKIKTYEGVVDGCKTRILEAMGNAAVGELPYGGTYVRKTVHRPAYTVDECDYDTLNFRKPKASKPENDE